MNPYYPAPMSDSTIPHIIEPGKWADRAAVLDVTLPLARFTRLLDGALSTDGEVTVHVAFARDARHFPVLAGRLETTLSLECQRCLQAVNVPLSAQVNVFMLNDDEEVERLSEAEDFVLADDGELDFPELLEDELILALPLVANHEDCEPAVPLVDDTVAEPETLRENPFHVLASLKKH